MKMAPRRHTRLVKKSSPKLPKGRARTARLPRQPRIPQPSAVKVAPVERLETKPAEVSGESTQGNNLQLYLREIGRVKLLTPQEEITLAKRIKKGDAQAREQMITANLRLVVKIARDYDGLGLPLLDLINEGNIGLMKGVERFDPRKGAKLSTYASWWIKQSIKRALANQSKTIRLPIHVVDKVAHIRRAEMKLRELFDREPTDEEVAEALDINPQRVRVYREASRAPISLDAPLGSEEPNPVADVVADTNAAAPFDNLVSESDHALVKELFATLPERERVILGMRFGLSDDTPKTLEEIGKEFGLTRERIRQIQEEALKKLRTKIQKRDSLAIERTTTLVE
jgi:RNA polymerase primary sigma factor